MAQPRRTDIVRTARGDWIVLERAPEKRALRYSADGRFEGYLGGLGQGPGEYGSRAVMSIDPMDSVWISHYGRAMVFGPDHQAARTLVQPTIGGFDGFTPTGLPFSDMAMIKGDTIRGYVQVWTREGEMLHRIGPGAFNPIADGQERWALMSDPRARRLATSDDAVVSAGGWQVWLTKWTRTDEQAMTTSAAVWKALGIAAEPGRTDGFPLSVRPAGNGGFWILGVIRRRSVADEEAAIAASVRGKDPTFPATEARWSPRLRNDLFDGVLVHTDSAGAVLEASTFDEHPWGFADDHHYVTARELEDGLIQLRTWRFARSCGS